jgi:hypothetical protein
MPQEDDETAKLEYGEEVGLVIFPTADQSAEIVKPGEQALDFPAASAPGPFASLNTGPLRFPERQSVTNLLDKYRPLTRNAIC